MIPVKSFYIAGVQFRPADVINPLLESKEQEKIKFTAEPDNKFDPNAIKIECLFTHETGETIQVPDTVGTKDSPIVESTWEHIGYVPKSDTAIFHLIRRLGGKISLRLDIKPGAETHRAFLVTAAVEGDETLAFNNVN